MVSRTRVSPRDCVCAASWIAVAFSSEMPELSTIFSSAAPASRAKPKPASTSVLPSRIASTARATSVRTEWISSAISTVERAVLTARLRISPATTWKPRPCSPPARRGWRR